MMRLICTDKTNLEKFNLCLKVYDESIKLKDPLKME